MYYICNFFPYPGRLGFLHKVRTFPVPAILNLMVVYVVVLLPIGVMLGLLVSDVRVMGAEKFSLSSKILYWAMLVAVEAGGFVGLLSIFQ